MNNIEDLILAEKERAIKIYGKTFASAHEAESVIREEVEEVKEELILLNHYLQEFWKGVRQRSTEYQNLKIKGLRKHSCDAIEELIQVCAMCDKFTEGE